MRVILDAGALLAKIHNCKTTAKDLKMEYPKEIRGMPQKTLEALQDLSKRVAERTAARWRRQNEEPPSAEKVFNTLTAYKPFLGQPIMLKTLRNRVVAIANPEDVEAVLETLIHIYGWQYVDFLDGEKPRPDDARDTATSRPAA